MILGQGNDSTTLSSNYDELGIPFIKNFFSKSYNADSQNWSVVQGDKGLMYFGNNSGVLEYDGVSWRLIKLPNGGGVRSLAKNSSNKVYVGGMNDLGYLEPDSTTTLQFVSVKNHLDSIHKNFNDIWSVAAVDDEAYFQGKNKIMHWKDGSFNIIESQSSIDNIKAIDNEIFLVGSRTKIKKLVADSLITVVDASSLGKGRIMDYLRIDDTSWVILSLRNGFFLYKNGEMTSFEGATSEFLKKNLGLYIKRLENGWFVFAALNGGLVVSDEHGQLIRVMGKAEGLGDDNVSNLYQDDQNGLWLALNNGISRVEILSPYTIFDERLGVEGYINKLHRHEGKLYMANTFGISRLEQDKEKNSPYSFEFIEEKSTLLHQGLDFISAGDTLFAASRAYLDILVDHQSVKKIPYKSGALFHSISDPKRIYVGLREGLASLNFKNGEWVDDKKINGFSDDVARLMEDKKGNLWVESHQDGLWKLEMAKALEEKDVRNPTMKHFRPGKELPEGKAFLDKINGEVTVEIDGKIYMYDEDLDSIMPNPSFGRLFGLIQGIRPRLEEPNGNIWMHAQLKKEEVYPLVKAVKNRNNTYDISKIPTERLDYALLGSVLFPEEDGVVWYGGGSGQIIRHDLNFPNSFEKDFYTNLRRVTSKKDSLIFGGTEIPNNYRTIAHQDNAMRFEFAATSFDAETENQYQYQLKGFDDAWSGWSLETQKDYTNLPEGDYTFKVRAKNIYGKVSNEDSYTFTILPPWYRTWWAYLFYALTGGMLLWFFTQWRSQQLRNKNLALETVVNERTEEIRHKNKLLNHQTEKLKELDTMKTRLFANISHEFRTPLTLIKGPIEKLESAEGNTISTPNIKMIRRNANRLLNLVNQLLDLSKLDSGKLKLNKAEGDVFKCIRAAASSFSSHAASRKMDYQIKISSRMLWADFDRDKLEKIIYNLLSNAFKFTDDEGQVVIESEFRSSRLHLKISDKGSGISTEKLPHIFDRFFQVDDSYTREKTGSGIGLALTKELTELMGGTIFVESELNRGTLFRVVVPLEEIKSGAIHETKEEMPLTVFEDDLNQSATPASEARDVKILIIEDNNDMRHFIREQLESDYDILEAINGKQGLEKAKKIVPDLIVTDLMMPQMDGITLCKKLKTDLATSHIPVIMLTAKAGLENKLEGLETGADEYLTKPFNARELQIRTKNLIESRQQLRELFSKNISLDPAAITVTSLDEEFLNSLLTLFEERHADSAFGVPQIQKELGMSKTALHAKVKALTNHPPGELLRNFKLKRAAQLLLQKADNVSQIAYDTGFNSLSYFTRCFKEYYGSTPSEFIKKNDSKA